MTAEPPRIRRIVTGHDLQGRSIVPEDGPARMVFILIDGAYEAELQK